MTGKVLILGSTGRFGRHATEAFWNRGWRVTTFDRNKDNLNEAARGVDLIVNASNPPYPDWAELVPVLTKQVIEAARLSGATVMIPGNVYVYGPVNAPDWSASTPHDATNPLGRIRVEMEREYRASGVKTIILRAGDYLDTEASGNWFDKIITAKVSKGTFTSPGPLDMAHAWAYLPDLAQAAVLLAEKRDQLDDTADILFPGFTLTLGEMAQLVERATDTQIKVRKFPWWAIRLASPFWKMGRSLIEMSYLWRTPHALDGTNFRKLLPDFLDTDPLVAVASALQTDIHPDKPMTRGAHHLPAE